MAAVGIYVWRRESTADSSKRRGQLTLPATRLTSVKSSRGSPCIDRRSLRSAPTRRALAAAAGLSGQARGPEALLRAAPALDRGGRGSGPGHLPEDQRRPAG